jgi:Zn-dependent M28 family amino/carboxypeptidase
VQLQTFDAAHPLTAEPVRMANLIATWHPQTTQRVLLACHYDTRPLPDRDPDRRQVQAGNFLGANDGASGVALFMELAHHMARIKCRYGVDFVLFDGEELVFRDGDKYFLGSEHFARSYVQEPAEHRYVYGVVVDMIGDRNLKIYMERNSLRYAPELTRSLFATARRLREDAFVAQARHEVQDDHLPLNKIAGIPTCDLIDFDFPYWHTSKDVPAACSGASLGKVGRVLQAWLADAPAPPREK